MICQWGLVLVVQSDGAVVCLKEKELNAKLELLYNKSLYLLALNLAQSDKVQPLLCDCCFGEKGKYVLTSDCPYSEGLPQSECSDCSPIGIVFRMSVH